VTVSDYACRGLTLALAAVWGLFTVRRQPGCSVLAGLGRGWCPAGDVGQWWRWVLRAVSRLGDSRAGWRGAAVPGG
jgi:hypothetical protein